MEFSIGIISAEQSLSRIREAEPFMRGGSAVTYLPYATMRQLGEVYTANAHRFDGLLFSGRFPYEYIVSHHGPVMKPYAYFELTDRDYYKMFASLLFRFPGIAINRVVMDRPFSGLNFHDIFGGETPIYFEDVTKDAYSLEFAYERTLEESIRLWRAGKIERVVTRLTNLIEPLKTAGIPCEALFPSTASIRETFRTLHARLQSRALSDSMTVAGIVCGELSENGLVAPGDASGDAPGDTLAEALAEFNKQHGMALVIRPHEDAFELTTANETLKDISRGYTHCLLSAYLHGRKDIRAAVGWGIGRDIIEAQQNAARAVRESKQNPERSAYLVTEKAELLGPLTNGKGIAVASAPDAATEGVSKDLGISAANLQKLIDLQRKRGTRRFTSTELAFFLNITPRSANRILIKLAERGAAEVVQTSPSAARGRPFKIYEVDYKRLDPRFQDM